MAPLNPRQKRTEKASRAKKLLSGVSLQRTDLDDDEQEWEWIYGETGNDGEDEDSEKFEEEDDTATPRKRRRRNASKGQQTIIGAKKGSVSFRIGDTVLVENENTTPWVAIICYFLLDSDGDMAANFLCESSGNCVGLLDLTKPKGLWTRRKLRSRARQRGRRGTTSYR